MFAKLKAQLAGGGTNAAAPAAATKRPPPAAAASRAGVDLGAVVKQLDPQYYSASYDATLTLLVRGGP
jgi:hypothetical protein